MNTDAQTPDPSSAKSSTARQPLSEGQKLKGQPREAISYCRFSTAIQASGDSLRRQLALSDDYAKKHNLQINRTLTDKGVSGFRGANLQQGALGAFIKAVEMGKVKPGSVLLIEALDRLSRNEITEQLGLFLCILTAGIEIVTLYDERSYTRESINGNPTELIISIVLMIRGWEESATKSFRLKEAWKAKRNSAGTRKLTSKCPLWPKPCRGGGHFEAIPERVKVVASIFELAEQGFGTHAICKDLNKQGVKLWSSGKWWNPNYVRRILRNRAVLGEFQPKIRPSRNTRQAEGPTQLGYYPAIISAGTFYRVNKDVAAPPVRPNRKDSVSNLFTGLAYDGESEAPMRFHAMWAGGTYDPALSRLFSAAVEKGGPSNSWNYSLFEASVLQHLEKLDWETLLADPADQGQAVERRQMEAQLKDVQIKLQRMVNFIAANNMASPTLAQTITHLEQQQAELQARVTAFEPGGSQHAVVRKAMLEARAEFLKLVSSGDPASRRLLRQELRVLIKRIDIWARPSSCVALREYHSLLTEAVQAAGMIWKKDPSQWPCYRITFTNHQQRWVLCERCRLKRRDAKQQDDSEALGVVIHLPTATAVIRENPDPGVPMPASDSQGP
jgi:DNA invertase Pin-like site-specific DNA recombinase